MALNRHSPLLILLLSAVMGPRQSAGQFPSIANVAQVLSNTPDPKKIDAVVKDASPKDVVQTIGSGVAQGQKKVLEASDQASAALKVESHALATSLQQTTTPLPTSTTDVVNEHPQYLAQAVEGTSIAKIGEKVLKGDSSAGVFKGNSVQKVTEAISQAQRGAVTPSLSEDAKHIAGQLSEASPQDVVQEVSQKGGSGTAGTSHVDTSPADVMNTVQHHASNHLDKMLGGRSAADIVKAMGNTSPKDIANALPDTTPNEVIQNARGRKENVDGIQAPPTQNPYLRPNEYGKPGDNQQSSDSLSRALMIFMVLSVFLGGGWYAFRQLTQPKPTVQPMLDGELGEGSSINVMDDAGPSFGSRGRARDVRDPALASFQRF